MKKKRPIKRRQFMKLKKHLKKKHQLLLSKKTTIQKNIEMTLKVFQKACIKHTFQISIALTHILSQNP